MIKYQINDNELLYLIYEMDDYAFDLLCLKYSPLIKSRIKDLRISSRFFDDFFQEGIIMLDRAVKTYKETMRKSFNRYFDLILQRRFIYLSKKVNKMERSVSLVEDVDFVLIEEKREIDDIVILKDSLSELEKFAFDAFFYKDKSLKDVAIEKGVSERTLYNALARAKLKIKKNMEKSKV